MSALAHEPLSYDAFKSVLKHMDLKKRDQVHWTISAHKKINSFVPYILDSVHLGENYMKVNSREWNIGQSIEDPDNSDEDPNKPIKSRKTTSIRFKTDGYFFLHGTNICYEDAFSKLVDQYLKSETKIERLTLYSVPGCLKKKNPDVYSLHVRELKLCEPTLATFHDLLPILNQSYLKIIDFCIRENNLQILDEPLVRSIENIFLQFPYYDPIPLNDLLLNLPNMHIHVVFWRLPVEKVLDLAMSWKESRRPIGDTFALAIEEYTYILDVVDGLKDNLGAFQSRIEKLGTSYFSHSTTIPICENTELVVFGGPMTIHWPPFLWTLRIEVMERGSTIAKID